MVSKPNSLLPKGTETNVLNFSNLQRVLTRCMNSFVCLNYMNKYFHTKYTLQIFTSRLLKTTNQAYSTRFYFRISYKYGQNNDKIILAR